MNKHDIDKGNLSCSFLTKAVQSESQLYPTGGLFSVVAPISPVTMPGLFFAYKKNGWSKIPLWLSCMGTLTNMRSNNYEAGTNI